MTEPFAPDSPEVRRVVPSPNHGERPGGRRPDTLVLHYTGMASEAEALAWLCDPASKVSSHYLVLEAGEVVQLVPESRRAWHAGVSSWRGEPDVNNRSIGIEIANGGHPGGLPPYPTAQIRSLVRLCRDIVGRWRIQPDLVLAHSDVAPGRKEDPGERFPWAELHQSGIGHWVAPAPIGDGRFLARGDRGQPVEALQAMLALYGYGVAVTGVFDEATASVVEAFQRHFRPARVDGVADASTIATLRDLEAAKPREAAA